MPDLKTREETFRDMLQRKFTFTPTTRSRVDRLLGKLFLTCAVLAIAAFIIEYGFFPNDATRTALHIIESVIIFIFCLMPLSRLLFVRKRLSYLREHMAEFIILGVYIIYVATSGEVSDVATNIWEGGGQSSGDDMIAGQLFIAANLIIRFARGNRSLASLSVRPVQFILFSFIGVIAVGTLLLSLPRATVAGYIHPIDAFFTATSATCVTGLVVVDTGSYFTRFGQGVIMSLFQIGGLGLMAFTAFFSTILGVKLARKEVALYSRAYEADTFSKVRRLLLYMLLATLLIELLGFGLLYQTWEPKFPDKGDLLFSAAFHSVSAFCNAGFSLNAANMEPYVHSTGTSMIVSWLIILGGLGFLVLMNLTTFRRKAIHGKPRSRLTLQTKLVLVTTVVLLLFGWLTITPLEWDNSFEGLSFGEKVTAGWFQSVTTRTAGFNTTPFNNLAPATIFIMIVLMFIGASPGSTGGGHQDQYLRHRYSQPLAQPHRKRPPGGIQTRDTRFCNPAGPGGSGRRYLLCCAGLLYAVALRDPPATGSPLRDGLRLCHRGALHRSNQHPELRRTDSDYRADVRRTSRTAFAGSGDWSPPRQRKISLSTRQHLRRLMGYKCGLFSKERFNYGQSTLLWR
jgi:hypothetical protein